MTPRSFTLLETLAVLVLLGLVAGWGLATIDRPASPRLAADRFAAVDARARLLAKVEGPQVLQLYQKSVTLQTIGGTHRRRSFELDSDLNLKRDGELVDRIVYDRLGQTIDFAVVHEGQEDA
ncbi:MAG: prepilin-type N-terminal cleavage/methylation domain-containing protein, partial [Planctomycetota bacterium]